MSIQGFYESEYQPLKQLGNSPRTRALYVESIHMFSAFLGRRALLSDLSDHVVSAWIQERISQGISPATANKHFRHVRAIWRYASTRIDGGHPVPTLKSAKEFCRKPRAWLLEEVTRLLHACGEETGDIGGVPAGRFWCSLVLTLYDTGARKDCVLRLSPRHVDLSSCSILLPAEIQKGGREEVVSIDPRTAVLLATDWDPGRKFAFPWPHDRYAGSTWTCINRHFKRIVLRSGIPLDTRDLFHRLRKTHASYRDRMVPGSATKALGHSSPKVTERHYLDPRITKREDQPQLPRP